MWRAALLLLAAPLVLAAADPATETEQTVKAGERIGIAGDAGKAARPELNLEIRHLGQDFDPASKLPLHGK